MKGSNGIGKQIGLLSLWIAIGLGLRFLNLAGKPVWTDEFATMVFSLGHSFQNIPLDRVISLVDLLAPLRPTADTTAQDTVRHLLEESNHPTLYFILMHAWLKVFAPQNGLVSVWAVRSLSALLGGLSVPALFGLGWVAFRSWRIAHLSALLGAISPLGVYLAQEARHYTLAELWVTGSLVCLVVVMQRLMQGSPPPWWVCGAWIGVNALGVSTHYFVVLTLVAEAGVMLGVAIAQWQKDGQLKSQPWGRVAVAAIGTLSAVLVWLPVVRNIEGSDLIDWIVLDSRTPLDWIAPVGRVIVSVASMLYLLPVEAPQAWVALLAGIGALGLVVWSYPKLYRGLCQALQDSDSRGSVLVLGGVVVAAIALFLGASYGFNRDLTLGFRYTFVYHPAVIVLVAAALSYLEAPAPTASRWRAWQQAGPRFVAAMLCWSLVGSLLVVSNLGFLKTHQPDKVVHWMADEPSDRTLIAMTYRTHGQAGRIMGIGLEWQRTLPDHPAPEFLLASQTANSPNQAILTLQQVLQTYRRPFDLWLVNFDSVSNEQLRAMLKQEQCTVDSKRRRAEGYGFRRYDCASALQSRNVPSLNLKG